ncbi:MAG TPA: MerR family transcriptional regulator [Xanthomonadaceae bacterium]|nr:MerR family transcriptional regulator [Xanthomonadaceae bacterium]
MSIPDDRYLRIGTIARRTGVSAKALRLYERRGLLAPCAHTPSGYRLYGPAALQRLARIVLLKRLGFTLAQVGRLLAHDEQAATSLLAARIGVLERELRERTQTLHALRVVLARVDPASPPTTDQLLETLGMSNTIEEPTGEDEREALRRRAGTMGAYFTEDEHAGFRQRAAALGEAGMARAQQDWAVLIGEVRAAMAAGMAADSGEGQALGRRWHALVSAFTGGDPAIARKLGEAYAAQPQVAAGQGMDPAMFGWAREAMAAAGLTLA